MKKAELITATNVNNSERDMMNDCRDRVVEISKQERSRLRPFSGATYVPSGDYEELPCMELVSR